MYRNLKNVGINGKCKCTFMLKYCRLTILDPSPSPRGVMFYIDDLRYYSDKFLNQCTDEAALHKF